MYILLYVNLIMHNAWRPHRINIYRFACIFLFYIHVFSVFVCICCICRIHVDFFIDLCGSLLWFNDMMACKYFTSLDVWAESTSETLYQKALYFCNFVQNSYFPILYSKSTVCWGSMQTGEVRAFLIWSNSLLARACHMVMMQTNKLNWIELN